ncbi:hypothetical protein [Streptomyces halobius]|uniref:Uncharacterized protein n=1 Tax=Streptomyces halobius TaxID=2879846 RepID=A0ABY4MH16_9ACTN|nr:hypothetical protein [Streptomyces halobius]UQA95651.1 hypothetical protein K9S39_30685 [Streptomyces halobius]
MGRRHVDGTNPVTGYEVRDTTGALLGAILPLGHMARHLHVEWYDPATEEFYVAGETDAVLTQGVHRVFDQYGRHVRPVPSGEGFDLDEPRYVPNCWVGACPEDCPLCADGWWERQTYRLTRAATS